MIKSIKSALLGTAGRTLAAVAAIGLAAPLANAAPIKVESENIVLYGDVEASTAMDRVRKWEIYRRMIYALSGISNPDPDNVKLTIYAFPDGDELRDFTDIGGIAGVYTNRGFDGPMFMTSVSNKKKDGEWSELVGLHEYTHHVTQSFVKQSFPTWYNEGFANYLSTMEITEDSVAIGSPEAPHFQNLKDKRTRFIRPDTVLGANSGYPSISRPEWRKGGMNSFYGQSTLYVHYMRSQPELNAKLPVYLARLEDTDVSATEAFEEVFGMTTKQFHQKAARYFRDNDFAINTYQPGPKIMDVDMKVTRLSDVELKYAQIPGRVTFMGDGNANDIARDVKDVIDTGKNDGKVAMALVSIDLQAERYDDAKARGISAMNANPSDINAKRAYADALYHAAIDPAYEEMDDEFAPLTMTDDLKKSLDLYRSILMQNAKDGDALTHVVNYYGSSEDDIDPLVFDAARLYDILLMDKFSVTEGMNLAVIYAKQGYMLDACDYYNKALVETEDMKKKRLGAMAGKLDWFKETYGQSCQVMEG